MNTSLLLENCTDTVTIEALRGFIKDYYDLFKKEHYLFCNSSFISADVFINTKNLKPILRILVDCEGELFLIDESFNAVLSDYENIIPLFKDELISQNSKNELTLIAPTDSSGEIFDNTYIATARFLTILYSTRDIFGSLYQIKTSDSYGVADCAGRIIIPPIYLKITVLPVRRNLMPDSTTNSSAFLFVCTKDSDKTNKVDVFDSNGNMLYSNIAAISLSTDTIEFSACSEKDPLQSYPVSKSSDMLCIKKAKSAKSKTATENIVTYTISIDELFYNEKTKGPSKPLTTANFTLNWMHIPKQIQLRNIRQILFTMSKRISKEMNKGVKEVMLSVPFWETYKRLEAPIPDITAETEISDIEGISIRTHNLLLRAGLRTVKDIIEANIDDLRTNKAFSKRVEEEIKILKYRLKISLK